jgi:drug/metabolite transporter (DMT)-like permease
MPAFWRTALEMYSQEVRTLSSTSRKLSFARGLLLLVLSHCLYALYSTTGRKRLQAKKQLEQACSAMAVRLPQIAEYNWGRSPIP